MDPVTTPPPQPTIVVNMPSSNQATPAPASTPSDSADPTVRYLIEQARIALGAGVEATPELIAKIESSVQGYGQGALIISVVYGGSTIAFLLYCAYFWRRLTPHADLNDINAPGFVVLISTAFSLIAALVCSIYAFSWLVDGAVAYYAPLVWLAKNLQQ
jgi:hypothetical protein